MIGALFLSLSACAGRYRPIDPTPAPADLPDASLIAPCDVTEGNPENNGELSDELIRTRGQRDRCAAQIEGVAQWRSDAIKRVGSLPKPK